MSKTQNPAHRRYKLFLIIFSLFFWGCKTTSTIDKSSFTPEAPYYVEEELSFPAVEEPSRYIFLRFYNPNYNNPLYIANLLQGGIKLAEVSDMTLSHIAINFSLEDDFYGLTSGGYFQLAQESCEHPEENKYMRHSNPDLSEQLTFALKVPQSEYESLQQTVEQYAQSHKVKYRVSKVFKIALFSLKRRYLTRKENRQIGALQYPKSTLSEKKESDPAYMENKFLCSTFIAYILQKNISSVQQFFEENNINYRYMTVTDLLKIPDLQLLFYSTWTNYPLAADAFVLSNPEFQTYFQSYLNN